LIYGKGAGEPYLATRYWPRYDATLIAIYYPTPPGRMSLHAWREEIECDDDEQQQVTQQQEDKEKEDVDGDRQADAGEEGAEEAPLEAKGPRYEIREVFEKCLVRADGSVIISTRFARTAVSQSTPAPIDPEEGADEEAKEEETPEAAADEKEEAPDAAENVEGGDEFDSSYGEAPQVQYFDVERELVKFLDIRPKLYFRVCYVLAYVMELMYSRRVTKAFVKGCTLRVEECCVSCNYQDSSRLTVTRSEEDDFTLTYAPLQASRVTLRSKQGMELTPQQPSYRKRPSRMISNARCGDLVYDCEMSRRVFPNGVVQRELASGRKELLYPDGRRQ
ncbi:hypothetical protein FOZ62_000450, partial [Perkinsus olseni]